MLGLEIYIAVILTFNLFRDLYKWASKDDYSDDYNYSEDSEIIGSMYI